jgi:hypothetical protein
MCLATLWELKALYVYFFIIIIIIIIINIPLFVQSVHVVDYKYILWIT